VTELLFVYGSLKRSEKNHLLLRDSRFLGEKPTSSKYKIKSVGEYPAMVELEHGGECVRGEVYQVDEALLAELDVFEEVPLLYHRKMVQLQHGTSAWAYFKAD